jgi:hypothetical protein
VIAVDVHLLWYTVHEGEFTELAGRVASMDARWVAPPLWRSEFRDTAAGYVRRGELASRCSAYDLEYVAVARGLGVKLVTNDQQILSDFPGTAVSLESFVGGSE